MGSYLMVFLLGGIVTLTLTQAAIKLILSLKPFDPEDHNHD